MAERHLLPPIVDVVSSAPLPFAMSALENVQIGGLLDLAFALRGALSMSRAAVERCVGIKLAVEPAHQALVRAGAPKPWPAGNGSRRTISPRVPRRLGKGAETTARVAVSRVASHPVFIHALLTSLLASASATATYPD